MDGTKMDGRGTMLAVWLAIALVMLTGVTEPSWYCVLAFVNLAVCVSRIVKHQKTAK